MDAARRKEQERVAPSGRKPTQPAAQAAMFRAAATRAAAFTGGPVLLFACSSQPGPPRLRAAAKLPSPNDAKAAATALSEAVTAATSSGSKQTLPELTQLPEATAGVLVLPLLREGRQLGALAVGLVQPLDPARSAALDLLGEATATQLDAVRMDEEISELRGQMRQTEHLAEEKNDEVLRLSEELFAQDIELLQNNEKLGKIEKLKDDFIEKMSRELRTPLNSIIESIIAVLAGENDVLSETAKMSLRAALDDGTAFLRTLQNILDLWRIKQGELPVEIQDVNFREVVEEAIFSIQDTLGNKPIAIEKHFEEPLPKIRTDLAKINQILFLLLDNAAKFTAKGKIEIRASVSDGQLRCELRDTGIGICPDDQQFVFDEFYQVDDLASTKYRGAGLGLALVRDLLVLLDGSISLTSEVGSGSGFVFTLPVQAIS